MAGIGGEPPADNMSASASTGGSGGRFGAPSSTSGKAATCVLWVAAGQSAPADLVESLRIRGVQLDLRRDGFGVMAGACSSARRARRDESIMVIFANPMTLAGAADVAKALARYSPRAVRWWFDSTGPRSLRAANDETIETWPTLVTRNERGRTSSTPTEKGEREIMPEIRVRPQGPPKLRLTDDPMPPVEGTQGASADASASGTSAELLTAEELAMLLRQPEPPGGAGGTGSSVQGSPKK